MIKSILFKNDLEIHQVTKISSIGPHICALEARKYADQLTKFLWQDEFSKLLLNKMDFSILSRWVVDELNNRYKTDFSYFLTTKRQIWYFFLIILMKYPTFRFYSKGQRGNFLLKVGIKNFRAYPNFPLFIEMQITLQ